MTYKTKAIVLKSRPFPRGARLYTLYSERFGKIKGVAAGSQKIKSKVAGHLQPFSIVEVMMAKGRTIDRLAQGRYLQGYPSFVQDFHFFLQGSYVLEVIESLTDEGVSDYQIWQLIEELFSELHEQSLWALNGFGQVSDKADLLIRLFALKLLDRFGFRPELSNCLQCKSTLNPDAIYFSVHQGGLICHNCIQEGTVAHSITEDHVKYLRHALQSPISQAHRVVLDNELQKKIIWDIDQMVMMQLQRPLRLMKYLQPDKSFQTTY